MFMSKIIQRYKKLRMYHNQFYDHASLHIQGISFGICGAYQDTEYSILSLSTHAAIKCYHVYFNIFDLRREK